MTQLPVFDDRFRAGLEALIRWRRDVRRFRRTPLSDGAIDRLLGLARLAPSVGLSEPWRFVLVEQAERRALVRENFVTANREALAAIESGRAGKYASLKLAGLDEAPVHLAVFAEPDPEQGGGLGRRTMPETVAYSVVAAIHTLWLAARAEGIGMGWVSILDPTRLADDLAVPAHWQFVGYFCLGYPEQDDDVPELERVDWEHRAASTDCIIRR